MKTKKYSIGLVMRTRESVCLHLSTAVLNTILRGGIITTEVTLSSMMDTGKITTQPTIGTIKCQYSEMDLIQDLIHHLLMEKFIFVTKHKLSLVYINHHHLRGLKLFFVDNCSNKGIGSL